MSRIGIIGSFRTSPVKTVLLWFAIVLPNCNAYRGPERNLRLTLPVIVMLAAESASHFCVMAQIPFPSFWCRVQVQAI
jgi:hypothetical protein